MTPRKRGPAKSAVVAAAAVLDLDVFDPAFEAHRLRMSGHDWRQVAARAGYASEADAAQAVNRYLSRVAIEVDAIQKRDALRTQLDRYESVLAAWWERATAPATVLSDTGAAVQVMDERAAAVVLKTLGQIDKLYNFGAEQASAGRPELIVIGGTPEEYTAGLRALAQAETGR